MSKEGFKKIKIFVASPKDVVTEKKRLISIVEQLNQGIADHLGIVLEIKEWSQVVPDMGRGQQIIFDQLPIDQWDIMIGILRLRYGSPSGGTNEEESGTHEEFNAAFDCWRKTGKPRIMFYRCIRPPDDITRIDIGSLSKINEFFSNFETGGKNQGLYCTYNATDEFEDLVREHLEKVLLEHGGEDQTELPNDLNEHIQYSLQPIPSVLSYLYDQVDNFSRNEDALYGVPTGFIDLDRLINGLQSPNFLLVGSRSNQNKTGFLLSIAKNAALNFKKTIAFFSPLGMSSVKLAQYFIAQDTGIDPQRLSVGKLTEMEWPLFTYAIERLADSNIFLNDTPVLSFHQLNEQVRSLKSELKLDLVIVDNLQFMTDEDTKPYDSKDNIYIKMKILAHELDVPVLTGIKLKRSSERRADKRPYLSDLDEFGSLEEIVDVIMFVHQPDQYDVFVNPGVAEIIVAKNNFGPTGSIELLYRQSLAKFENAVTMQINPEEANKDD